MTHIALSDAQQQLAELIAAVGRGEEFVILVEGKPAAKVGPPVADVSGRQLDRPSGSKAGRPQPQFGSARGKVWMADDFDAPLDDFAEYM